MTCINTNTVQNQQIMDRLAKVSSTGSTRSLRAINILAFIPGIILLLASGLVTPVGSVSFVAVLPLTLSALLGLKGATGRKDRPPIPWTTCADLFIAMFFVSILIPLYVTLSLGLAIRSRTFHISTRTDDLFFAINFRWFILAARRKLWSISQVLVCAYSTMPLIVDLYVSAVSASKAALPLSPSLPIWLVRLRACCTHILRLAFEHPGLIFHETSQLHTLLPLRPHASQRRSPSSLPLAPTPILP